MPKSFRLSTLTAFSLFLSLLPSPAQQAPPSADTFVSSATPAANYGSSIVDAVGPGTTTYIRFNLAGVPAGATVTKATLRLYVDAVANGGQFDIYNLPGAPIWSENTLTFSTPPPVLGTSATGGNPVTITASSTNTFLLIDITATVQGWLTNPGSNNGVALARVGTTGLFSFDSKEALITSHEPELEIVLAGSGGPAGPPGPQGPQGLQGPIGLTGPAGSTGATGANGNAGPQGAAGATGATGAIGPIGPVGPQGVPGTNGTKGQGFNFTGPFNSGTAYNLDDVVTFNGSTYNATVAIAAGGGTPDTNSQWALLALAGTAGSAGATGPAGPIGLTGPVGPQGLQGGKGDTGATGAQGPVGLTGATGAQGVMGPMGPIGPQGTQGSPGTNGINGQGFNFTGPFNSGTAYSIDDVTTFNGSTYNATAAIPAGGPTPDTNPQWALLALAGAIGPAGVTGGVGPVGPQGAQGVKGDTGATGSVGPQGVKGDTGAMGAQGSTGMTGATGPIGPMGFAGPQGPAGPQGIQGVPGSPGTSGPPVMLTGYCTGSGTGSHLIGTVFGLGGVNVSPSTSYQTGAQNCFNGQDPTDVSIGAPGNPYFGAGVLIASNGTLQNLIVRSTVRSLNFGLPPVTVSVVVNNTVVMSCQLVAAPEHQGTIGVCGDFSTTVPVGRGDMVDVMVSSTSPINSLFDLNVTLEKH